ncbi:hypothetical protein SAMN02745246_00812 [Leeuwenhoekiella marinoflava DSM 3653]|uniref:Uncharacterized protein n=2 Tax=Leeuwenhoekiella marinoflava TaxID=988 RepID=A0A4Q0PPN5_9FLAO|nr:hypothetical protein DSL99_864 [Leeuwenhoekiella marinoflava]SHE67972.1 hypothetical protein SAMN02745246_00812 [Leeuwenhoekiella marinoflava DSM 3653]
MLFSGDNHFFKTLNTLLNRYKLSNKELVNLQKVKKPKLLVWLILMMVVLI